MSLPYSHTSTIILNTQEDVEFSDNIVSIRQNLKKSNLVINLHSTQNGIHFTFKSLFGIQYTIEVAINERNAREITYDIKLIKLINVSIFLVLFTAFFSSFGVTGFLWFSAILTLVFFSVNTIVVNSQIQELLKSALNKEGFKTGREEILSPEQSQWMKDNSKCPACGEDVTEYDRTCPECGIKIRENVPTLPFNISKYRHKRIKYHFKEKKKNSND